MKSLVNKWETKREKDWEGEGDQEIEREKEWTRTTPRATEYWLEPPSTTFGVKWNCRETLEPRRWKPLSVSICVCFCRNMNNRKMMIIVVFAPVLQASLYLMLHGNPPKNTSNLAKEAWWCLSIQVCIYHNLMISITCTNVWSFLSLQFLS